MSSTVLVMNAGRYRTDHGFRAKVHAEILRTVEEFRSGKVGVIAASRTLGKHEYVIENSWPELATALRVFVGINSETDALPIGRVRDMWHPDTAHSEDQKVEQAERCWMPQAWKLVMRSRVCWPGNALLAGNLHSYARTAPLEPDRSARPR